MSTQPNTPDAEELARNSGVPFLAEAVKRKAEPPSPPPTPEPADDDEEVVVVEGDDDGQPQVDPIDEMRSRLEEAERKLAQEEERRKQTRSEYQRAQAGQELQASLREALEGLYQETQLKHAQAQAAQQQVRPPTVDDGEKLLVDADALQEYVRGYGEYVKRETLAGLTPFLNTVAVWDQWLPGVMQAHAERAWDAARGLLSEEGYSDLDDRREELEKLFSSSQQAQSARLDPQAIRLAYLSLPSRRKRQKAAAAQPPPTAGRSTEPAKSRRSRVVVTKHHREIAQRLGLDPVQLARRTHARRSAQKG